MGCNVLEFAEEEIGVLRMNCAVAQFTNSKPTATAARFDETEPAATRPNASATAVLENADGQASWGAALRSRTAGSRDESRCGAIHEQCPCL